MTRKRLLVWVEITLAIYALAIVTGIVLKVRFCETVYLTYKDLLPLIVALPAAWLVYCFQRRGSYLQALRTLWSDLVKAAKQAADYTRWETPRKEEDFRAVILELTKAIDSLRGVFRNVPQHGHPQGLYPYENLKDILRIIGWLGFGDRYTRERADLAHRCIWRLWAEMHYALLREFDTEIPMLPVSKYLNPGPDLTAALLSGRLTEEELRAFDERKLLPGEELANQAHAAGSAPRRS